MSDAFYLKKIPMSCKSIQNGGAEMKELKAESQWVNQKNTRKHESASIFDFQSAEQSAKVRETGVNKKWASNKHASNIHCEVLKAELCKCCEWWPSELCKQTEQNIEPTATLNDLADAFETFSHYFAFICSVLWYNTMNKSLANRNANNNNSDIFITIATNNNNNCNNSCE